MPPFPRTARGAGSIYPRDLSSRLTEQEIFRLDTICRANQHFVDVPELTVPTDCTPLDPVITFADLAVTFNRKSGIVIDLDDLRSAEGVPLDRRPGNFYRVEVLLEDAGQEDAQMAIRVLDSLWAEPGPEGVQGITVGINNDQRTFWFDNSDFADPLDQRSRDLLERFVVLRRRRPAGEARDVPVEIYITPNGTYPVIDDVNVSALPDLYAGSFTSYRPAKYIVLGKWDARPTPVTFKQLRIVELDDLAVMDGAHEVNAHFIGMAAEETLSARLLNYRNPTRVVNTRQRDAGVWGRGPRSQKSSSLTNPVGLLYSAPSAAPARPRENFNQLLWDAFLYRAYDYYFDTAHVPEVRDLVDEYLARLPPFVEAGVEEYMAKEDCTIVHANHYYTNILNANLYIIYAISSYLRADQLDNVRAIFGPYIDATISRIYTDGRFPLVEPMDNCGGVPVGTMENDTFAEELAWMVSVYAGYYVNFPYDRPRSDKIKEYLTFVGYHTLADGSPMSSDPYFDSVDFQYLTDDHRDFRAKYIHDDYLIDNHDFHPSINYALGIINALQVARNVLLKSGTPESDYTIHALSHNTGSAYAANIEARLLIEPSGYQTFRHKHRVPVDRPDRATEDIVGPPDADGIINLFVGLTYPSLLEDWANTFNGYNAIENHISAENLPADPTTLAVDRFIRQVYYTYYTGKGLLFCAGGASPCTADSRIYRHALYALVFSQRSGFDAREPEDVFVQGPDNALWRAFVTAGGWRWQWLGGQLASAPAVVAGAAGQLDVFVQGQDNGLWRVFTTENGWEWQQLGGQLASAPVVVAGASGQFDVFVQGQDNGLWRAFTTENGWEWQQLGGQLASAPAVVAGASGQFDVFAQGQDNALWRAFTTENGWEWQQLGGQLASAPAVVAGASGEFDVFAQGQDNGLWHAYMVGEGWRWQPLGGQLASAPAVVASAAGQFDVFAQGQDNGLWRAFTTEDGWEWQPLGGALASAPAIATAGPDRYDIFARGADDALWWAYSAENGWQWQRLGGALASTLVVTARLNIFAWGVDGALWWAHIRGGSWYWEQVGGG